MTRAGFASTTCASTSSRCWRTLRCGARARTPDLSPRRPVELPISRPSGWANSAPGRGAWSRRTDASRDGPTPPRCFPATGSARLGRRTPPSPSYASPGPPRRATAPRTPSKTWRPSHACARTPGTSPDCPPATPTAMRVRVPVQIARADANEGAIGVDLEGCRARPAAVVPLDPALLTSRSSPRTSAPARWTARSSPGASGTAQPMTSRPAIAARRIPSSRPTDRR
jgi:hypothetical protein